MNVSATPQHNRLSAVIAMPFGPMGVMSTRDEITELLFLPPDAAEKAPDSLLAEHAATALHEWLNDPERPWSLPLARSGTPFQRRVWELIAAIPRGSTRTYAELAQTLASAPRPVGGACGANPFPLLVPCHRVVGTQGLGGFARDRDGHLIRVKQWLLAHERA